MENKDTTTTTPEVVSQPPTDREPVKEKTKIKRPMTDKRREQLAKARAIRSAKALERKKAMKQSSEKKYPIEYDEMEEDDKRSEHRLVKGGNESAERFKATLEQMNPELKMQQGSKNKKRKLTSVESEESNIDMKTATVAGLGLLAVAGASYVAGKNLMPVAMKSGFTGHGSAIPGDSEKGIPAIPIISQQSNGRPYAVPSLGLYSTS